MTRLYTIESRLTRGEKFRPHRCGMQHGIFLVPTFETPREAKHWLKRERKCRRSGGRAYIGLLRIAKVHRG